MILVALIRQYGCADQGRGLVAINPGTHHHRWPATVADLRKRWQNSEVSSQDSDAYLHYIIITVVLAELTIWSKPWRTLTQL